MFQWSFPDDSISVEIATCIKSPDSSESVKDTYWERNTSVISYLQAWISLSLCFSRTRIDIYFDSIRSKWPAIKYQDHLPLPLANNNPPTGFFTCITPSKFAWTTLVDVVWPLLIIISIAIYCYSWPCFFITLAHILGLDQSMDWLLSKWVMFLLLLYL